MPHHGTYTDTLIKRSYTYRYMYTHQETVTDKLCTGILPTNVHDAFQASKAAFRRATKLSWTDLTEHFQSLAETDHDIAAIFPESPEDPLDDDSTMVRPTAQAAIDAIWDDALTALAMRTECVQRIASSLTNAHSAAIKSRLPNEK